MTIFSRRTFVKKVGITSIALTNLPLAEQLLANEKSMGMQLGLVTYLWGKDMKLDELIKNCEKADILGVELRKEHAHGVEPHLSAAARKEVKKRFQDSPVELVGFGPNIFYHQVDEKELAEAIELTKKYILLSEDTGGSGVKVQPNQFNDGIPREKTIEQIGKALNELGRFGADHGQEIRLEVHGPGTAELPNIKAIMDIADHPNVGVCWNCNDEDLIGDGLAYNFNLVKDRLGKTVHIREMNVGNYPYQELFDLLNGIKYNGWVMLECRTDPSDKVEAMKEQQRIFKEMI